MEHEYHDISKLNPLWKSRDDDDAFAMLAGMALSRLARKGFEEQGRGILAGPFLGVATGAGFIYVPEKMIPPVEAIAQQVSSYDPQRRFVFMSVTRTGTKLLVLNLEPVESLARHQ